MLSGWAAWGTVEHSFTASLDVIPAVNCHRRQAALSLYPAPQGILICNRHVLSLVCPTNLTFFWISRFAWMPECCAGHFKKRQSLI